MKKKKVLIAILIAVLVLIASAAGFYYHFFISMNSLPEGELITSSECENCGAVVNAYIYNGGATVSYCTRAEVVYPDGKIKNIYWSYGDQQAYNDEVDLNWVDCETISINGKHLNIYNDKYDFRREVK